MVKGSQLTNSEIKYKAVMGTTTCVKVIITTNSTLLIGLFCNFKSTSEMLEVLFIEASQKTKIYIHLNKKKNK